MERSPHDTCKKIEEAVCSLSEEDLRAFRQWFAEFDAKVWDRRLETDAAAGRLESFAQQALTEFREGKAKELYSVGVSYRIESNPEYVSSLAY